ncbi:unnamed protein product [Owenia fusiformis]|uniref:Deacetylase sirtuin-type domain-containing protein n=1 Tax=Owenia fusiformis TaxID=6347 RepID=A0A8S4PYI4_OWEFU|nr:unnamed protein product [Owenia fusiformis]
MANPNPKWFESDHKFAWGFYGHRYKLYKNTTPHEGFGILLKWAKSMENGYHVYTSNVDGHFQKAGFPKDRVDECHGSIHYLQCADVNISDAIWPVPDNFDIDVEESTLRAPSPLPLGPPSNPTHLARPNIKMFHDVTWIDTRTSAQEVKFKAFEEKLIDGGTTFIVIEIGSGLAVPRVRERGEAIIKRSEGKGTLIRINPAESTVPHGQHIGLPLGALEAITSIDKILKST